MGYIRYLLYECYMLYQFWIHLKYQHIIYNLGINFINMYFGLQFLTFNKITFILAIIWINLIEKLVTGLQSLKQSVITD